MNFPGFERWRRIDAATHEAKFFNGIYQVKAIDGEWTLWFQANYTRGFIRKPGTWQALTRAKRMAQVYSNDYYLERTQ